MILVFLAVTGGIVAAVKARRRARDIEGDRQFNLDWRGPNDIRGTAPENGAP